MAAGKAKVLIHSQGESEGPLVEAIDHYRPQMIFLISNQQNDKAEVIQKHLDDRNQKKLGDWVKDVEHAEMIFIDDAWSSDTVLQMFQAINMAKEKAKKIAGDRNLEIYCGVSGGTKLMVIGSALGSIHEGITTYYAKEERPGQTENLVIEIGFLNQLMKTLNWLEHGHYKEKNNLRYLRELIRREDCGEVCTAQEMATTLSPTARKTIQNAMRVLKEHNLVEIDQTATPQVYSSTTLGRYVLNLFHKSDGEQE